MPAEKKPSKVKNPAAGAGLGVIYSLSTLIGEAAENTFADAKRNVHDNCITVLVGGVITGAMAGMVSCCAPESDEDSSFGFRLARGLLDAGLVIGSFVAAPIMGEAVMNLDTKWNEILVDELIGDATVLASVAVLACGVAVGYGAYKSSQCVCSLFAGKNTGGTTTGLLASRDDTFVPPV